MAISNLVQYLNKKGVVFELMTHVPAYSAHNVAAVTHIPDSEMAKTLVVKGDNKYWMIVLMADYRLDERALKKALGVKSVHLVTEEELAKLFPDCEIGAMPPIGELYSMPVVVDKSIIVDEEIIFNACTHTESIKMKFKDFEGLVKPRIAEFGKPPYSFENSEW